ncbi:MAG: OmpA family protein, partial [Actinomycetota bacterium]|nr:OmpA family protein [Actinomycetota bacterium]
GPDHARRKPLLIVAILAAVGAVAVVGWLVLLRPSGPTEITEAATTVTIDAAATPVDQIRAVLDGLGYGSVLVEERVGTVHLAGVLGSDRDRSAAVAASQALAGDMMLDSSGLTIGGEEDPTDPPASETDSDDQQSFVDSTPVDGPYVEATLDGKDFVLAGVVPSAALATSYMRAAEVAYAPYVRSELVVDEQLDTADWLARGPNAIILLPMIVDGKLLISNDHVQVSGRSPDEAGVERLSGALGQITGLPVVVGDMEVMSLQPPSYVIAADAGVVELGGQVPTQEIRDMLVEGAVAAYGTGNVTDHITVDETVHPSLWMYSGGPLLQAMSTFPDYELRIDGTAFSGFINGGVDFESGSAVFSGDYAQTLDVGVSVLTRDPSLQLVIEGHTDDRGFAESNRALSQLRAEAVRDYFIINGIDPSRLTAIGIGEAEPVVSNGTEAGRARNRRIQYVLSTATSLPGSQPGTDTSGDA